MSDRYLDDLLPDFGEYSLDSILDDYRQRAAGDGTGAADPAARPVEPAKAAEAIAQRSRQIVMQALGETLGQRRAAPDQAASAEAPPAAAPSTEDAVAAVLAGERGTAAQQPQQKPRVHVSPDGVITLDLELPPEEPAYEDGLDLDLDEEELGTSPVDWDEDEEQPARGRFGGRARRARRAARTGDDGEKLSAKERFLMPMVRLVATKIVRRQMQRTEAANWPDPVDVRETDELPPKKASRFYGQQLRPLRFRCRVCLLLCVTLGWISLGLPMAGLLGRSLTAQAGVSLMLLLTVMMATLDVLAAGVRQLFDLHPGAEALAALSALLSCVDGVMVMAGYGRALPFCAVGAVSLSCALWAERLGCHARARTMRMVAMSKNPSVVTAAEMNRGGRYICRTQRPVEGAVRRSEQADFCQTVYGTAAPILLALSLVLAILASLHGMSAYFLHTLSALLAVSASFTSFLSFPLPYDLTAGKLQGSGAAIVGYAGCADIGRIRRVVISDNDLFPPGTMRLNGINILEGALVDKVISCTASLLAMSGSGTAGVFLELVQRRGYAAVRPEEFRCHEGGGLSARCADEQVLVGSAGFMNLMGIRLPQGMQVKNAVCTAISGELVGVFTLEYIPVSSVQDALVTLLQGRTQPIFAIRDFNITPLMIRQLFRMPTDNFTFPTFRDRYRIAAAAMTRDAPIAAVLSRGGMGPMVDAAEAGRRLYSTCRIGTVISLAGTGLGLVILFLLCRSGAFSTATAGNVLSYMLLWSLPVIILAVGQNR